MTGPLDPGDDRAAQLFAVVLSAEHVIVLVAELAPEALSEEVWRGRG